MAASDSRPSTVAERDGTKPSRNSTSKAPSVNTTTESIEKAPLALPSTEPPRFTDILFRRHKLQPADLDAIATEVRIRLHRSVVTKLMDLIRSLCMMIPFWHLIIGQEKATKTYTDSILPRVGHIERRKYVDSTTTEMHTLLI